MTKHDEGSAAKPPALVIAPESPYPIAGGGALRSASLIEYLASRYALDVVVFREAGTPDPSPAFPPARVRRIDVLTLPRHSRAAIPRIVRNSIRLARGVPPLIDRYAGLSRRLDALVRGRHYALCLIEHFWCAPYADVVSPVSDSVILDLHNVESILQQRSGAAEPWAVAAAFHRFSRAYHDLEHRLLPRFDRVLVPSEEDAAQVRRIHAVPIVVYPNTIPSVSPPSQPEEDAIVFSGNLEYHPNLTAVRFFLRQIWPLLHDRWPRLEWRLVGRNPHAVAALLDGSAGIRLIGPVDNAIEELAAAKVAVVPLLAGSGTRFKILEAWAASRAVVSTSIGAEGLGARPGEHLLIADTPTAFAESVSSLLDDPSLRRQLGEAGRALYLEKFTWESGWTKLAETGL